MDTNDKNRKEVAGNSKVVCHCYKRNFGMINVEMTMKPINVLGVFNVEEYPLEGECDVKILHRPDCLMHYENCTTEEQKLARTLFEDM